MLPSHGFMVAFKDVELNGFAKSFLFKKGRRGKNRYFWKQQLPLKLFSYGFPIPFSDVPKVKFTMLFLPVGLSTHRTVRSVKLG